MIFANDLAYFTFSGLEMIAFILYPGFRSNKGLNLCQFLFKIIKKYKNESFIRSGGPFDPKRTARPVSRRTIPEISPTNQWPEYATLSSVNPTHGRLKSENESGSPER